MKYAEYLEEIGKFCEQFEVIRNTPKDQQEDLIPAHHNWLCIFAEVTCETPGCPHGTRTIHLMEHGQGHYSAWCGNCNTQITKLVGIFEDQRVDLEATVHDIELDPWEMNEQYDATPQLALPV